MRSTMIDPRPFVLLTALAIACATTSPGRSNELTPGPGERKVTFSIQGLVCSDCAKELEQVALRQAGVHRAMFDANASELHLLIAKDGVEPRIQEALETVPIDGQKISAVLGAGKGSYAPFAPLDPSWDASTPSPDGRDVADLRALTAAGKVTVVDFYADWCGPCHDVDNHMHALLAKDAKLAYRRINVVSWDTPVAKHYLAEVEGLPFLIVFDARGEVVRRISGLKLDALDAAIEKGHAQ